jgi:hypothetical protein
MNNILKLADKFQQLVSQVVNQQDIGDAEKKALVSSGVVVKMLNYIKQYFAAKNLQTGPCSIKTTLTINTDQKGNPMSANTTQFETYCQNIDLSFDMGDLNAKLLGEFGKQVADIMLKAYKTNAACRNVLKAQFAENTNQSQVVVISV